MKGWWTMNATRDLFSDFASPTDKPAVCVCWGAGWDSSAMLIEMERRGERPDLITFADTGGEKPGTYAFIPTFTEWLLDHDFPAPVVCEYTPKDETAAK